MFVGMASMMVPGFDTLDLANQSEPVRIPAEILPVEGFEVFAMMSDNAIGASVGEHYSKDLAKFMEADSQDSGTFFSVSYDIAKQMEIQMAMAETLGTHAYGDTSPADELSKAVRESYTAMLDRSRVDMRFTADGLVIDSSISFK
jgi:hypothetical protein